MHQFICHQTNIYKSWSVQPHALNIAWLRPKTWYLNQDKLRVHCILSTIITLNRSTSAHI
ncbi:hypothetical protein CDL12_25916 [Handroanthus impetiginosus]|uniref:Uncharacterized protein n=1 Tax=Handroanthus impetiginosus TaxID=429701 RepID=A0A2G9G8F7_9LAMI|nr:hypothetical protein CDL12_25916 [Handroanthus impetiginosus]